IAETAQRSEMEVDEGEPALAMPIEHGGFVEHGQARGIDDLETVQRHGAAAGQRDICAAIDQQTLVLQRGGEEARGLVVHLEGLAESERLLRERGGLTVFAEERLAFAAFGDAA